MSKIPITVSWSGGKDSTFALYHLLQSNIYEVKSLHTVFDSKLKRVGLHGVPERLIEAQAESLGFPLEKIYLPQSDDHDAYEQVIREFCMAQKNKGIDHVMYGDIFLEDLKAYRDKQLATVGLEGVYPIWNRDTKTLVEQFVQQGFKTVVCAANAALFEKLQVGQTIDQEWLAHLPASVDPCGENGEFHTFVYDGPMFNQPVSFRKGEMVDRSYTYNRKEEDGSLTPMKSTFYFQELLHDS